MAPQTSPHLKEGRCGGQEWREARIAAKWAKCGSDMEGMDVCDVFYDVVNLTVTLWPHANG